MNKKLSTKSIISLLKRIWQWNYFPIILLACISFSAHFLFFQQFGIYEDDISLVAYPYHFKNPFDNLPLMLWRDLLGFFQGRPIGFMLPHLLSIIFGNLGGLPAIYIGGFLSIGINASLMYLLVYKWTNIKLLAFLTAVIFTMYPADTTHLFLSHNLSLQYALTWLLLAFLSDLANKKWLAFIFAAFILMTYETPYWIFLSAPLFQTKSTPNTLAKRLAKHFLVMLLIMIIYSAVRIATGEGRVHQVLTGSILSIPSFRIPMQIIVSVFIGPITSLSTFLTSIIDTFQNLTLVVLLSIPISLGVFYLILNNLNINANNQEKSKRTMRLTKKNLFIEAASSPEVLVCFRLILASLPAMGLAYIFSFTKFPADVTAGRLSSVHLASAFPGAILVSSCFFLGILLLKQHNKNYLGTLTIAVILSLIFGYRISIQQDFQIAWLKIRRMTTQIIDLIQDVGPTTMFIIDTRELENSRFITAYQNQHLIIQVLKLGYYLEPGFDPLLIYSFSNNQINLFYEDGQYYYERTFGGRPDSRLLEDGNIIYIHWNGARFIREFGEIQIVDANFHLKPQGETTLDIFEKTPVYEWYYQPELLELEGPIELDTLFH